MADDEVISCVGGDLFDTGEYGTDELAFELVYDDPDGMGFLHAQVAGEAVGAIAHLLCGVHDALAGLDIDGRMIF